MSVSRQARHRADNRAAGLCACGARRVQGVRCADCYERHRAYMAEYMRRRRAAARR